MKLSDVLEEFEAKFEVVGDINQNIRGLYHNSKEVTDGGVFFALEGSNVDGNQFIEEAISNGAKVIVSSCPKKLKEGITNVIVNDTREAMSLFASSYYDNPSLDMFVVGVTGTNGKTTSTFMLASIFKEAGRSVGIIGTNGIYINGKKYPSNFTTPDPIILQETLAKMRARGVNCVVMEVSAHALELQKIRGVMTDIALFTNLTQDHLDYFKTMENYGRAKAKFFQKGVSSFGVVNYDDEFGKQLFENIEIPALTYSRDLEQKKLREADIIVLEEKHNTTNTTFKIASPKGEEEFTINLAGGFNVSNALGAISAGIIAGIPLSVISRGLNKLEKVAGRFNTYDVDGVRVIIDFAHTPDGLENILTETRKITEGEVYAVFGCGGNRDAIKRPIMGNIASRLANYTIITSDNPRNEFPDEIASEIERGMDVGALHSVILDRENAIKLAISMAKKGDSVVIAGKGAEDYMEINGEKIPYSDCKVVESLIEKKDNREKE